VDILYRRLAQQLFGARDKPGKHDTVLGIDNLDKVIDIDQSPIGRTPRSNPATYTTLFTDVRDLFATTNEAKMRGYKPGRFSLRQRRALRSMPGRRHYQDRNAILARRVRSVRSVSWQAI
jgi:excinuclease ABC subunit A